MSFAFYWAHRYQAEPGWTPPPPPRRPYATLWLILEGALEVGSPEGDTHCGPGTVIAWPPDVERRAVNREQTPVVLRTVAFNLRLYGDVDFFRLYQVPTCHQAGNLPRLAEPCHALIDELAAHPEAATLEAEGWARVLVGRWLTELAQAGKLRETPEIDQRVTRVLAAMEEDLAGEWSLDRLAELMRLSKVRMREVFVRSVGLPPMRYLTMRRIARARSLLAETDLSSAEVADRCGFEDPAYFSRVFHRLAGLQPLAYREQTRFVKE